MRKALLFTPALLAACATTAPPGTIPVHGVTPGHKCDAKGTGGFIGQAASETTAASIKHATKAAVLRWAPPGTMLTMDYREDRVTVWLDENRKITKVRCG
jgi:hypothetical protein